MKMTRGPGVPSSSGSKEVPRGSRTGATWEAGRKEGRKAHSSSTRSVPWASRGHCIVCSGLHLSACSQMSEVAVVRLVECICMIHTHVGRQATLALIKDPLSSIQKQDPWGMPGRLTTNPPGSIFQFTMNARACSKSNVKHHLGYLAPSSNFPAIFAWFNLLRRFNPHFILLVILKPLWPLCRSPFLVTPFSTIHRRPI